MPDIYITCACQNCGKGIEFDRSQLRFSETRTIECPHCHLETIIFDRNARSGTNKIEPPEPAEKRGAAFLKLGCIIMFLVGLAMVSIGCSSELSETESAIRQTVNAIQYGTGFLLILLSMILAALIRLITNE